MRFWEYLVQDFRNFDVSCPSVLPSTKSDNNIGCLSKSIKKPDKKVALIQPKNFDQILEFVDFVSGNRSAVIDFNMLAGEDLVRAVDFVSGAVCALHGQMEKVSAGIYLFAPACTKLITQKRKKRTNEK